jgi:hypothetical protein
MMYFQDFLPRSNSNSNEIVRLYLRLAFLEQSIVRNQDSKNCLVQIILIKKKEEATLTM